MSRWSPCHLPVTARTLPLECLGGAAGEHQEDRLCLPAVRLVHVKNRARVFGEAAGTKFEGRRRRGDVNVEQLALPDHLEIIAFDAAIPQERTYFPIGTRRNSSKEF